MNLEASTRLDARRSAHARHRRETQIPWSYDVDRVTASAVDPDRLYVYWEVTDGALERARTALGDAGAGAWLALRVYDTSGRLFDGSNAHRYFDQRVDRGDRQWFFTLGRPSSTAVVEVGVRSPEGRFVKIARSKRVDFPRREPSQWSEPEWMAVRAGGEIERAGPGLRRASPPRGRQERPSHQGEAQRPAFEAIPLWVLREVATDLGGAMHRESWETAWQWVDGAGWIEPATTTSWTAGPFSYPVEIQPPSSQVWRGRSVAYRVGGVTHIVDGPWQVVIRNLGAYRQREVVSRWQMVRSWVASSGREARVVARHPSPGRAGASEHAHGASERAWLSGSELRLGGASERWRLGASEVRLGGGSERLYAGASQWMLRGGSELRLGGASETRLGGSERRLAAIQWG